MNTNSKTTNGNRGLGRGLDSLIPEKTVSSPVQEVDKIARANVVSAAISLSSATEGMNEYDRKDMLKLIIDTATFMLMSGRV